MTLLASLPHRQALAEFLRFALVGAAGFVVDIAVLQSWLAVTGDRPYSGQAIAWCVAVTANWWLNRVFTFRDRSPAPLLRQWAHYVAVNSGGAAANYAVYAALVWTVPLCRSFPVLAVAAGTVAGLAFNFLGSRAFVFRR